MKIQWYPGHMTKAIRNMQQDVKIVDLIIEMVDARAPLSTRNPDIDALGRGKGRIIIMNKADMADPVANAAWREYFIAQGWECVTADSRSRADIKELTAAMDRALAQKRERDRKRGILNRPVRAMVAGIPNVGKSTLINTIAGKGAAKTGNRPGVTKGNQWIRLNKGIELLDTPGITWPKFEDEHIGEMIAYIGSVNDMIVDKSELALSMGAYLIEMCPDRLESSYGYMPGVAEKTAGTTGSEGQTASGDAAREAGAAGDLTPEQRESWRLLEHIARVRGCLARGGEPDYDKAQSILINDFRSGRLGRITLELPPEDDTETEKAEDSAAGAVS